MSVFARIGVRFGGSAVSMCVAKQQVPRAAKPAFGNQYFVAAARGMTGSKKVR